MNFTRIIGQNNTIYCKLGDYCMAETNGEHFIICNICQKEYRCTRSFQKHLNESHKLQSVGSLQNSQTDVTNSENFTSKAKRNSPSPNAMYMEAEYLENDKLNDANVELVCDEVLENAFEVCAEEPFVAAPTGPTNTNAFVPQKEYIIDKISSKHLLNGKVLKKLFKQMQCKNHEFHYRLHSLVQRVQHLEKQLKKSNINERSNCMKIIPQQPFSTRNEVLTLDEDLHRSKEMRNCLHDEALLVMAENAEVYARLLWRTIMNDEVAKQFCWRGVIEADKVIKYPIKDLTLLDVFQGAFREKFPAQPINYFKERTMVYFNKAAERLKRRQLQRKHSAKTATYKAAADDSEVEDRHTQQHSTFSNFTEENNDYNEYYTSSCEMLEEI